MISYPWVGGVGWGGMITFMFLCTHRHSNLIIFIFLPVEQRQAQLFHDQLPVGWGELIRFMFLCLHTHSNLIIFLALEHFLALLFHVRWVVWKNLGELQWENTKAAPPNGTRKQLLSELSCVRWVVRDELCEMSCVTCEMRRVVWVVRWVEWCETSSVTCEMRGVVWDELCELWDEFCERTWVNFSERTRKQLHQMAHESSSWVSWVV